MRQAEAARSGEELLAHQALRRIGFAGPQLAARLDREAFIYTRAGVLDATRQRVEKQPAVEPIVGRIGGARTW